MTYTTTELIEMGMTEITKRIRHQLKAEFPLCTFSVRQLHSSEIAVSLMRANIKVVRDFKDISEMAPFHLEGRQYTPEQIKERQEAKYCQLNTYWMQEFKPDEWNNGIFLTEAGHNLLKRVIEIVQQYNWDRSDIQADYFDVHFYLMLELGQYNKPLVDGVE